MWWQRRSRQIEDIGQQLTELTQYLRTLSERADQRIHVNVESLHVDQASLEKLIFQLDNLDIQELSGSLNLGNNFGKPGTNTVKRSQAGLLTKHLTNQPTAQSNTEDVAGLAPQPGVSLHSAPEEGGVRSTKRGYSVRLPDNS